MKYLICITISILLVGCSSTATKTQDEASDTEFGWIENKDFNKVQEVPFKRSKDLFDEVMNDDSLSTESIARLPEAKIDVVSNSQNPVDQGISRCYNKRFDEAEAIFKKNYRKYKSNPSYWNQVGTCHLLKGENRKALLFYNKSRSLNGKYPPPVNNIGVIHQRQGDDQKALAAYKKAVELNSFSLTPIFNLAQLYLKYGFADKARKTFRVLYEKNSSDVDVLNALGTAHLIKKEYNTAVKYFSRVPRSKLSDPKFGINFSLALKLDNRPKDAETIYLGVDRDNLGDLGSYYARVGRMINE